ncbi:MAG: acyl carrier protein [Oscillospiraceae bacterium]|nr:acyl carrier protein [Oscillospiraceae bacterium]
MFEKVQAIVAEQLGKKLEDVKLESSIAEDLGADSLDIVDLVMDIEEEFDVTIPDEKVEHMKTVEDIVKHLEAELGKAE